jgi:hypothetical protein
MPVMSFEDSNKVIDSLNTIIKTTGVDTNKISDGYHTFSELYEHRIILFIVLLRYYSTHPKQRGQVWRSKAHSDGSVWDGWFILGIGKEKGFQITYHLPISKWVQTSFAETLEHAPEWDGHTSGDVLERLKQL